MDNFKGDFLSQISSYPNKPYINGELMCKTSKLYHLKMGERHKTQILPPKNVPNKCKQKLSSEM